MKHLKWSYWLTLACVVLAVLPLMSQSLLSETAPPEPPELQDFHAVMNAGAKQKAPAQKVTTTIGKMVGKYMALGYTTANVAQRYWLDIEQTEGNNVTITNLMNLGTTVNGTLDPARGVISIAPQKLFNDPEYGDFILYVADIAKKAYYPDRNLEFTLQPDGSVTTGNWGAFIVEGDHRGYASIHHKEVLWAAKASMTDRSLTKDTTRNYPVVFIRENDNKILIKNFYNYGADIVLTVDSAGNVKALRGQVAQGQSSTGALTNFYNYAVTNYVSPESYKLVTTGIPGTWKGNSIELEKWAVASSTTLKSVYELLDKTVITVPDEFVPFSSALSLKGEGTAENPFLIETARDLQTLGSAVNYSGKYTVSKKALTGKHFLQTADIDMAAVPNFEPIGYATASTFNGTYDGGGHTIFNLTVNRRDDATAGLFGIVEANGCIRNLILESPTVSSTKTNVGSAVGQSKGLIENVTVRNGNVSLGSANVGGVAGNASGRVKGCSFSGTVNGGNFSGGIIGLSNGDILDCVSRADIVLNKKSAIVGGIAGSNAGDTVRVENCHFAGSISDRFGSGTIGGIAGYFQRGTMRGCWNSGTIQSASVSSNTTVIGGIAGMLSAATITDCLVSGWLESPDAKTTAGMVGKMTKRVGSGTDEPKVLNSLLTGTIVCPNSMLRNEFTGETILDYAQISGLIFDSQTSSRRSETGGMATARLASGEAVGSLNPEIWVFEAGHYPALKTFATTDAGLLASSPFFLADGDDVGAVKNNFTLSSPDKIEWLLYTGGKYSKQGHGLAIENGIARITATSATTDTLVAFKGTDNYKLAMLKIAPIEFEGLGTEESPYIIRTRDDLMAFRNAVDLQAMRYTGVYFRLGTDIDMGGDTGFIGLSSQGADGAFNGTFDGNGHCIRNWIVDRAKLDGMKPTVSGASSLMAGFFLYTGPEAVIKNLTMDASCSVIAGSHVAALVSQNNGTIINCRNNASVTGLYNEVGGLVAFNSQTGVILDSQNNGEIRCGRQTAGGIAGANLGMIERCQNDGTILNDVISALSPGRNLMGSVGGVAGYNAGTVADCLGAGKVDAPKMAAGLIGENRETGKIITSLVTGICMDPDDASAHGAIMGSQGNTTDTLSNIYYDLQLSATTAGAHSSQKGVTGLTTSRLTDGSLPEGFSPEVWSAEKGRYPVLKNFASSAEALFNARNFVTFSTDGRDDSRFYMRREARVSATENSVTSLRKGDLVLSSEVLGTGTRKGVLTDTLIISDTGRIKEIPILASTGILEKGDGSTDNPWLIETTADWNTIADFSNIHGLDLRDENFRVMSDLDFSGETFKTVAQTGVLRFQGCIDGNGKTFDNISILRTTVSAQGTNVGIVGILGEDGRITNLTIGEKSRIAGFSNTGAFAGQNAGLIEGCTNRSKVSATNTYAGGIGGYVISGGRFQKCENFGAVNAVSGQAGGIAGGNGSDIGGLIRDCRNHGSVVSGERSAGGIIGSGRVDVINCLNKGSIHAHDTYAGGIVGYHTYDLRVDSCHNEGTVIADKGMAGGIVGFLFSSGTISNSKNIGVVESSKMYAGGILGCNYRGNSHVVACVNSGDVKAATTHAGGIVGYLTAGTDSTSMNFIRKSVNYGKVTSGEEYCGGITGEAKAYTRLFDVMNHGDIYGDIYVGGIAGCLLGKVDTCLNTGTVKARRYSLGGIAGVTNTATTITAAISNAANFGKVLSEGTDVKTAFNVGGILGGGNIKINNAINVSDLRGYKTVGGIVGLAVKGSDSSLSGLNMGTCISNSYSIGTVEYADPGNTGLCGHIIGANESTLPYTSFSNLYFDRQQGSAVAFASDSVATPLATASFTAGMLGDGFIQPVAGTYPMLEALAKTDAAIVFSSALALEENATRHNVRDRFRIIAHEGVEWNSSDFTIEGNEVRWSGLKAGQTYTLTARKGDVERVFALKVEAANDGVESVNTDVEPVAIEWYSTDGQRLASAISGVCIKVMVFSDGRRVAEKVIHPAR